MGKSECCGGGEGTEEEKRCNAGHLEESVGDGKATGSILGRKREERLEREGRPLGDHTTRIVNLRVKGEIDAYQEVTAKTEGEKCKFTMFGATRSWGGLRGRIGLGLLGELCREEDKKQECCSKAKASHDRVDLRRYFQRVGQSGHQNRSRTRAYSEKRPH